MRPRDFESTLHLDPMMAMRFDPAVVLPEAAFSWALRQDLAVLPSER